MRFILSDVRLVLCFRPQLALKGVQAVVVESAQVVDGLGRVGLEGGRTADLHS